MDEPRNKTNGSAIAAIVLAAILLGIALYFLISTTISNGLGDGVGAFLICLVFEFAPWVAVYSLSSVAEKDGYGGIEVNIANLAGVFGIGVYVLGILVSVIFGVGLLILILIAPK